MDLQAIVLYISEIRRQMDLFDLVYMFSKVWPSIMQVTKTKTRSQ